MPKDDVNISRLVENVRYLTKKSNIASDIQERVLSCLDIYEKLIECDINLAYELARDLNIIRVLIKNESEDLERKFLIFEKKLRKLTYNILPKETKEEDEIKLVRKRDATIIQNENVRIIDTNGLNSAMKNFEQTRELESLIRDIIKLADSPNLSVNMRHDLMARMSDVTNLLRINATQTLVLKKDILDVRIALERGKKGQPELDNKLKILKLKLMKIMEGLDKKEEENEQILKLIYDRIEGAIINLEESLTGQKRRRFKQIPRPQNLAIKRIQTQQLYSVERPPNSNVIAGETTGFAPTVASATMFNQNKIVPNVLFNTSDLYGNWPNNIQTPSMAQSPTMDLPAYQGFMLVPIDTSTCPGLNVPGNNESAFIPGYN